MNVFKLFERIATGDLRPHLDRFDTHEGINELENEFYSKKVLVENDFLYTLNKAFDNDFLGYKDGDRFELEIDEETDPIRISFRKIPNPNEGELINIDIPPPPDEKS